MKLRPRDFIPPPVLIPPRARSRAEFRIGADREPRKVRGEKLRPPSSRQRAVIGGKVFLGSYVRVIATGKWRRPNGSDFPDIMKWVYPPTFIEHLTFRNDPFFRAIMLRGRAG